MLPIKKLTALAFTALMTLSGVRAAEDHIVFEGKEGPGKGKHIVFLAGDEEYRSEEGLPMLAKLLSERHGFKCTVLFSVDNEGFISPDTQDSLTHPEALDSADAIVMLMRFRHWPDDVRKHFTDAVDRGVPIVGLRTSTHAFNDKALGSFGKKVLGESWVSHWGSHKHEATRGIIEEAAKSDPILNGVSDLFVTTDVYEAHPPADAKILVRGQVLKGMNHDDAPADYRKKTNAKEEQGVNEPMMPIAWTRVVPNDKGKSNRIMCTTMGAATDLVNEGLRRLIVNAVYQGLQMDVPAKADVEIVGVYEPSMYGFKGYKKGVKPADLQK